MSEATFFVRTVYCVLIAIFTFCGVLRYCNFWQYSGKSVGELYPARKTIVVAYFSVLFLIPCALNPESRDAQLLAEAFWPLYIPALCSLAYKSFFYGDTKHKRLRIAVVGGLPAVAIAVMSVFAAVGGDTLWQSREVVDMVVITLGAALTIYSVSVSLWLGRLISMSRQGISLPSDPAFPLRFAQRILIISIFVQIIALVVYFINDVTINACFTLVLALLGACILIAILRPQREQPIVDNESMKSFSEAKDKQAASNTTEEKLPAHVVDSIELRIRDAVEKQQMFLNPNLTKSVLAQHLGINDLYLYLVLKQRFGQFNRYVNILRLNYSLDYQKRHPEAKREEIAMNCGFGSVRTYYRAKNQYWDNDSVIDGVSKD